MPTNEPFRLLFTAADVARFCEVDLKTIHNWANSSKIDHFRTQGRHLRFHLLDVVDFLRRYGYPQPEAIRLARLRVVAVDVDAESIAALRRVLARRFDLTTFNDPVDALVSLSTLQPDVLVLELQMPDFNGVRTVERLSAIEETKHIRVVAYSSHEDLREPVMAAGAKAFVFKGDESDLRDVLDAMTRVE
jgi:PleD family two-component response regulator